MAWVCPICEEYHIDEDSVILEVLDKNNKPVKHGQMGKVVVTGIVNYLIPNILYDLGDYAIDSKRKPKCGRLLTLMREVIGRENDFLLNEKRNKVPPCKIIDILDKIEELAIFQVIQKNVVVHYLFKKFFG